MAYRPIALISFVEEKMLIKKNIFIDCIHSVERQNFEVSVLHNSCLDVVYKGCPLKKVLSFICIK